MSRIVFFDTEVSTGSKKLLDIGAVTDDMLELHSSNGKQFADFISDCLFVCGHNIFAHDLKYLSKDIEESNQEHVFIDTLPLSPLLFPKKPYHHLVKDDKLQSTDLNNPLNDAKKAEKLFYDEVEAFNQLSFELRCIYCSLLAQFEQFRGFFSFLDCRSQGNTADEIRKEFAGKICENTDLESLIASYPVELAYALANIYTDDKYSVIPAWVNKNYPDVNMVMEFLRDVPCRERCEYCRNHLDIHKSLKRLFGFDSFRTYNGEPLQENAAQAAAKGYSLLAIFPTGGGKSLTFQLPALMAGETVRGLTVVISPLQSLMKDQVDNLEQKGITDAVTINGLLNPLERSDAIARVMDGSASILYISPESLRSSSIENLLLSRNVVRFVIDEAHCFSAWGQDFRVDYLYIGDFIRTLQEKKNLSTPIPISCFTATAKQKVISDIREYFRQKLNVELTIYSTDAARENLRYEVLFRESEEEKYSTLRNLIRAKNCPTIVYVSSTKKAAELAARLTRDGLKALPFHGKMENREKVENQNSFMMGLPDGVDIMVATSAFGMGVDKNNVGLVVHYTISNSLEDYVQEAGRAGRDPSLKADCYVLFNESDLDNHFARLSQQKLSINEIKQVWKAVKQLSGRRGSFTRSALEIARQAGWNENVRDIETRVKTAIAALENAGYVKRGKNVPHVFADGILAKNMQEAGEKIDASQILSVKEKQQAKRIMSSLISAKYRSKNPEMASDADTRVDTIADREGLSYLEISRLLDILRKEKILADSQDMSAFINQSDTQSRSENVLTRIAALERYLIQSLPEAGCSSYKELNDGAVRAEIKAATVKDVQKILNYWQTSGYIDKIMAASGQQFRFVRKFESDIMLPAFERKQDVAQYIISYLYSKIDEEKHLTEVNFSILELTEAYNGIESLFKQDYQASLEDIRSAVLYLNKIGAMTLDGGFLVFSNALQVERIENNNTIQYKKEDYEQLKNFYDQKIQQVHIVGKYAQLMTKDYTEAQTFVHDYFQMDYMLFIRKYLRGEDIKRPITSERYNRIFGELSAKQREIIDDDTSQYIVVAAGPGSGKTKVLVHKLASLLLLEDVKSEQLLMLTFSRSAAMEFKERLVSLIGSPAYYLEIKTFHSYCFDLLGRVGNLEDSKDVVKRACELISRNEADMGHITKTVLVIDEAQDMDEHSFALVKALMSSNEDMRVIAVGDDDQNIFEFRGSSSKYLFSLLIDYEATKYELIENFRSRKALVSLANCYAGTLKNRMKTHPIEAVQNLPGICRITDYKTPNLETATVKMLRENYSLGTCCVLTATNDSALRIVALLHQEGYKAKLIQAIDGFALYDLAEIRTFVQYLGMHDSEPIISQETWIEAVERLKSDFTGSICLQDCLAFINRFDKVTPTKFRSDFMEYINESSYEDIVSGDKEQILVSTIHKSKGREFDSVYMVLNNYVVSDAESRRVLYVGMTRAKKELYINCNNEIFNKLVTPKEIDRFADDKEYSPATEIIRHLTHRDVNLGYFQERQTYIQKIKSGTELFLEGEYLFADFGKFKAKVAKLSRGFLNELHEYENKGYQVLYAEVRFLVYWHKKEETAESDHLIVLPTIRLISNHSNTEE